MCRGFFSPNSGIETTDFTDRTDGGKIPTMSGRGSRRCRLGARTALSARFGSGTVSVGLSMNRQAAKHFGGASVLASRKCEGHSAREYARPTGSANSTTTQDSSLGFSRTWLSALLATVQVEDNKLETAKAEGRFRPADEPMTREIPAASYL